MMKTIVATTAMFSVFVTSANAALINHFTFDNGANVGQDSVGSRDLTERTRGSGGTVSQVASVTDTSGVTRTGVLRLDDETPIGAGSTDTTNGSWMEHDDNSGTTHANFTVALWFRTDHNTNNGFSSVFSNGPNTGNNNFQIDNGGNNVTPDDIRLNARNGTITDPTSFAPNTWFHVAATYDGSDTKLFVDGVQSGSTITTGNPGTLFEEIRVGSNRGETRLYDSDFDDLGIFSSALSTAEVRAIPSLALNSALDYDLSDASTLFTLNDDMSGTVTIGGLTWTYVPGLNTGNLGQVVEDFDSFLFALQLDGIGGVAVSVPEPTTFALTALGLISLGLVGWPRRRRA